MQKKSDEWDGDERRDGDGRWQVDKHVPIALIITLALQTGGVIWWASSLSTKMDSMAGQMIEFRAEKYTAHDAERDARLVDQRLADLARRVGALENKEK